MIVKDGTIRYFEPVTQMLYKYDREIHCAVEAITSQEQAA